MRCIILNISMSVLLAFSSFSYGAMDFFYVKLNDGSKIKVTLNDLRKLPSFSFKTSTNYTPPDIFLGVKVKDFAIKYNISGSTLRAFAWDDYSYSMPLDELYKYDAIIAYSKGGKDMNVTELGPFAIVYPRDSYPELSQLDVNAKTVWQIRLLEVK